VYYLKKPKKDKAFELTDDNFEYFPTEWNILHFKYLIYNSFIYN
jgi:hypothetical protein